MKKQWKKMVIRAMLIIFGLLIVTAVVPFISYLLSEKSLWTVTGNNDWAGFWGGYAGAIIGGLATLIGINFTIKENRHQNISKRLITGWI